jgi:hypothetical protein
LGQGIVPLEDIMLSLSDAGYGGYYEFESVVSLPLSERVDYVRAARTWFDGFCERNTRGFSGTAR